MDWDHKDRWTSRGRNFSVEISRHELPVHDDDRGPHRWCVYAYVYPAHPLTAKFKDDDGLWQEATQDLPLHCGPTFVQKHVDARGALCSWQVGADYNHLGDERFTHFATLEEAGGVRLDAEALFAWLSEHDTAKANGG